jgi:hypothetical protein
VSMSIPNMSTKISSTVKMSTKISSTVKMSKISKYRHSKC